MVKILETFQLLTQSYGEDVERDSSENKKKKQE
jgi:hypothetical protein